MATTIVRTPWIDDDGSGTTGTVLNNAIKTELYNQIDGALAGVGTSAGVEVVASNAAVVTLSPNYRHHEVRFYGTVLHGFTKTGAQEGDEVLVVNSTGLGPIELAHDSVTATTSTDRLWNFATSANTRVSSNGSARYVRDYKTEGASGGNDRWRMVAHEQGAWITTPFNAANFAGNGSMIWTVDAGDRVTSKYRLSGRNLTYAFCLPSTSVGGTPNNQLWIAQAEWGGFTSAAAQVVNLIMIGDGSPTYTAGYVDVQASASVIALNKFAGAWTASTHNTFAYGEITFEVV